MSALEHRTQIPPRKFRHEPVLAFFGKDAASTAAIRLDQPAVIGVQHAMRVPSEFARRFEHDHAAGDGSAKGLPLELSVGREVGRIAAQKIYAGAVAVPFWPLRSSNKPSPNPLRRSSNRNLIARVHG